MAEQILVQFRVDKDLKQEVAEIYDELGMDLPTALRMFMKKSKQARGLPFEAVLPESQCCRTDFRAAFDELRSEAMNLDEVNLDEINAEIVASRAERKK